MSEPDSPGPSARETYNPWSVVDLVFAHLAAEGLHPTLGHGGDPGAPARALLVALGIDPHVEGSGTVRAEVQAELARLREAVLDPLPADAAARAR